MGSHTSLDAAVQSSLEGNIYFDAHGQQTPVDLCSVCGRRQFNPTNRSWCKCCRATFPKSPGHTQSTTTQLSLSEQVCERLKELRLAKGWSQPRLAGLVSCPRTYISKYERGHCKPTLAVLAKLAEAFQVHLADLVNVQIPANLLIAAGANEDLFMALREALPVLTRSDRWLLLQAAKNLPKGQMPFPDWSPV